MAAKVEDNWKISFRLRSGWYIYDHIHSGCLIEVLAPMISPCHLPTVHSLMQASNRTEAPVDQRISRMSSG